MTKEGKYKFTLIDFGICQKLTNSMSEKHKVNDWFRGNLMFCSNLQLQNFRPTRFCDLQAAVAIAYYLIFREVPSTEYAK